MALGDLGSLGVRLLLVFFIVTMVLVDKILKLAKAMLQMNRADLDT